MEAVILTNTQQRPANRSNNRRTAMRTLRPNPVIEADLASIVSAPLPWQALSGATVLITGAAGFLPAYMVETLLFLNRHVLTKPARVIGLVRTLSRAYDRFQLHLDRTDLQFISQDVSDPLTFRGPVDYIVHAASQASPVQYLADPVGTLSANVLGTNNLLNAAQRHRSRGFLFVSSGAVYGNVEGKVTPLAEHEMGFLDPADDRACYAESKRMAETMCVAWAQQHKLPTRIVRPWQTYGPGMRLNDGRVFADFVRDILNGGPIVLRSDGRARRCFCYLADATLGFFTVLLKGGNGEAYNVANPNGESGIGELADRLARLYGAEGVTVQRLSPAAGEPPAPILPILPSVQKLERLGWRASSSIDVGFGRTVDSYRS